MKLNIDVATRFAETGLFNGLTLYQHRVLGFD